MDSHFAHGRKNLNSLARVFFLLGLLTVLSLTGCATTSTVKQVEKLKTLNQNAKILLIAPDVKYYLLTTGGVPQPHAEWTEAARNNFSRLFLDYAASKGLDIVASPDDEQLTDNEIRYQKLYSAVGSSVLSHHFGQYKLPTKKGAFDWSLGPGISAIGEQYGADYALFSYYRDYQASGGRAAFTFFAALMGVAMSAGGEVGYASLVDLRNGDIVWFNRVSSGAGELRNLDEAKATIDLLFKDMPTRL